jgi:UDP-3-O-[3-hydroxymyristoyl] glucosamine N-acyltransferase
MTKMTKIVYQVNRISKGRVVEGYTDVLYLNGVRHYPHPNGGGFVAETAQVDATAFVGSDSMVLGYARIRDHSSIEDTSIVKGYCRLYGGAIVAGDSVLDGDVDGLQEASVYDSVIFGAYSLQGSTRVVDSSVFGCGRLNKARIRNCYMTGTTHLIDVILENTWMIGNRRWSMMRRGF